MNDVTVVSAPAARASNASKIYGKGDTLVTALDSVDVAFQAGKFSAIMGPSGSGKSTLMHCMAGLDNLSSGKVFIGETDLTELNEKELTLLRRSNVGFIFQSFNLVPTLNALENITLPIDLSGNAVDTDWVNQVTGVVNLSDRLSHKPNELSGGQQQRVAVSRALASKPNIIFADENVSAFYFSIKAQIINLMMDLQEEFDLSIIFIAHDLSVVKHISDRIGVMYNGELVEINDTDAIFESPKHDYTKELL